MFGGGNILGLEGNFCSGVMATHKNSYSPAFIILVSHYRAHQLCSSHFRDATGKVCGVISFLKARNEIASKIYSELCSVYGKNYVMANVYCWCQWLNGERTLHNEKPFPEPWMLSKKPEGSLTTISALYVLNKILPHCFQMLKWALRYYTG